jgi:hypothetical protein
LLRERCPRLLGKGGVGVVGAGGMTFAAIRADLLGTARENRGGERKLREEEGGGRRKDRALGLLLHI